jgi:hypothetical protein
MRYSFSLLFLFALASYQFAFGQQDSTRTAKLHRIILKDGTEFIGTIQSEDSSQVDFLSSSKITMKIPRDQIKSLEPLSANAIGAKFRRSDPNYTRLFFSPTGRPLKDGQGYFSVYEVFFPFFAVGIGNAVTLAGGVSLIPGSKYQVYYFAPKLTPIHLTNLDISAGVLYVNSTAADVSGLGVVYAVGTYGSSDGAMTACLGWNFAEGELSNKPVLLFGGELRISESMKLVTENFVPPTSDFLIYSFGLRFFGESLAADLGFIGWSNSKTNGFPFIPWVGFVYNFGAK